MQRLLLATVGLAIGTFGGSAQGANQDSSVSIPLVANVGSFCKVAGNSGVAFTLVGGAAELGTVKEVCNSPGGYMVQAQFANLASGAISASGEVERLGSDSSVRFVSPEARNVARTWSLYDSRPVDAERPVFMNLSILPL